MTPPIPAYEQLRALPTLLGLPIETAMTMAAHLVDGACERASADDLARAIQLIGELQTSSLDGAEVAELWYYAANAWAALRGIGHPDKQSQSCWRQLEMENELLSLRKAAHSDGFASLPPVRRAQILTNTGNLLNTIGRSLEALRLYDDALRVFPSFGMAMGNRGAALKRFALSHYDRGQVRLLLCRAWRDLTGAPSRHLEPGAEAAFKKHADDIETWLPRSYLEHTCPAVSLGRTKSERQYREWALREGLFLNPLIALGTESCAARDTLGLPNIVTALREGPGLLGMFTQIKQEFVSARFLAWEGLEAERTHFSDRETHLVNTLDYAVYGLAIEKTKIAFRVAYSVLDKCAFLLNKYLGLGIDERRVNLNTVWFTGGRPDQAKPNDNLNPSLVDTDNWPLRGLFWLARDIRDPGALRDPIDPDAQELKEVRDHLEHKYLKVHDPYVPVSLPEGLRDQYARSVDRTAFVAKTLKLLRLAQSASTYLSLGIHREERRRAAGRKSGPVLPMSLPNVPDQCKR
jgi:hypothetical protein